MDNNEGMRPRKKSRLSNYDAVIASPVGRLGILIEGGALADISFLGGDATPKPPRTAAARKIHRQLRSYFTNPHFTFSVPMTLSGTAFQQRVWRALQRIPAGRTLSYGMLARQLTTSARAVGNACRANPIPIIIPCHRVVASNGAGGFMGKRSGAPLRLKHWLLEHERDG